MCKESSSSGASSAGGSKKGDEVELVSKFLAPLCARDETARNLALAAARTTVEGWLGGFGSPNNNWEGLTIGAVETILDDKIGKYRSPYRTINANYRTHLRESFDSGCFYPQSLPPDGLIGNRKPSFDDKNSVDCVDAGGATNGGRERRYSESSVLDTTSEDVKQYIGRHCNGRIRSGRQKQFDEDEELSVDCTRVYGKSPKFDDGFQLRQKQRECSTCESSSNTDNVVFNTLDGFFNDDKRTIAEDVRDEIEKKTVGGQTKRPLSQDDETSWKTGRLLDESPVEVVTPGDVGRMLNLGNALDEPRQAQPNKYLSLVSLHLPVILRLSVNCPFQNVRDKCTEIIEMIKVIIYFYYILIYYTFSIFFLYRTKSNLWSN